MRRFGQNLAKPYQLQGFELAPEAQRMVDKREAHVVELKTIWKRFCALKNASLPAGEKQPDSDGALNHYINGYFGYEVTDGIDVLSFENFDRLIAYLTREIQILEKGEN